MRLTALVLTLALFSSCRAPTPQPAQPQQQSCKPKLPVDLPDEPTTPQPLRKVSLVKLPSGELVEEVRR